MADEMMNDNQGGVEHTHNGGKAWGWVVLIVIILLVIWGLFALGDDTDDVDVDEDTMEEIQEDLEDTEVMDDEEVMEDVEAELEADVSAE